MRMNGDGKGEIEMGMGESRMRINGDGKGEIEMGMGEVV